MRVRLALDSERPSADSRPQTALFEKRVDPESEGLAALIDERRELLVGLDQHPEWAQREAELCGLLTSILDSSRLQLLRIDLGSPTPVLDKIVKYEAVHPIRDMRDLERRLANDRRCYAFFHPALPGEPLIFTELALTHGMSSDVRSLLNPASHTIDPHTCDCAIFYSISSGHEGLRGVPLGNALIRRVTDELGAVFPKLNTFATLSPVPGFRSWLESLVRSHQGGAAGATAVAALSALERSDWYLDADLSAELQERLAPFCAYYLLRVKRGDQPADAVARFHLRNGARLERINWLSDPSTTGMHRAAGMMVNYTYRCSRPGREYDASTSTWDAQASWQVKWQARRVSPLFRN